MDAWLPPAPPNFCDHVWGSHLDEQMQDAALLADAKCSVLEVLGTVFDCRVSTLCGEGTPNDGMRETVWVLGKYPNDAV